MCTKTLWHTLETTTIVLPNNETFVHTGDIDDLWLRDSAAQIHPLLVNDALFDAKVDRIVSGLITRHALYIRHDPYANAFRIDDSYVFSAAQKKLGRHDLISTWNYELDSGCYTIRMMYFYWKKQASTSSVLYTNPKVKEAVSILLDLWTAEQEHELDKYPVGELLDCVNCGKPYRYPGLKRTGKGTPTNATAGLIWSGFRPSDDECRYGYLVPANMFVVTVLGYVLEMATAIWKDGELAKRAKKLSVDVQRGILQHAIVEHETYGEIYAFEVDGLGNSLLMDDANVPSLLSLPYLNYPYLDEEIYTNTRRFLLSKDNPTFNRNGNVYGIGSPHMAQRIHNNVWPMAMAMEGLTTFNRSRQAELIQQLVDVSANTLYMHESFDVGNPRKFTRSWFCWADSLYAELVLRYLSSGDTSQSCPGRPYKVLEWRDPVTVVGGRYDGASV